MFAAWTDDAGSDSGRMSWAVWQVTEGFRAASLVGWRPGWMIGGEGPLLFLLLNFGLFLPVTLVALWVAVRERRRAALFLLVPALAVFAALFLVAAACAVVLRGWRAD